MSTDAAAQEPGIPIEPDRPPTPAVSTPPIIISPAVAVDPWKEFREARAEDRAYFQWLTRVTLSALGIIVTLLVGAAVYLVGRTLNDVRGEARRQLDTEVVRLREEVRSRIENEFRTDTIRRTVQDVARERSAADLRAIAEAAVAQQLKPAIDAATKTITVETAQLRELNGATADATFASNGDRVAFDRLVATARTSKNATIRELASTTVERIINEHNSGMYTSRGLNRQPNASEVVQLLKNPDPQIREAAAYAAAALKDRSLVSHLIATAESDQRLPVSAAAFRAIAILTGQENKLRTLDFAALRRWWQANRGKFQ